MMLLILNSHESTFQHYIPLRMTEIPRYSSSNNKPNNFPKKIKTMNVRKTAVARHLRHQVRSATDRLWQCRCSTQADY